MTATVCGVQARVFSLRWRGIFEIGDVQELHLRKLLVLFFLSRRKGTGGVEAKAIRRGVGTSRRW